MPHPFSMPKGAMLLLVWSVATFGLFLVFWSMDWLVWLSIAWIKVVSLHSYNNYGVLGLIALLQTLTDLIGRL